MPMGLGLGLGLQLGGGGGGASIDTSTQAVLDLLGANALALWDAEDETLSAGAVASWVDQVAAYDLTNATGDQQPIFAADSFNSRPGVTFDGSNDQLWMASVPAAWQGAGEVEVWALCSQDALVADTSSRCVFGFGGGTTSTGRRFLRNVVSAANRARAQIGTGASNALATNSTVDFSGRVAARYVVSATETRVDVNGTAGTPQAVVPATGSSFTRIGATDGGASLWQGAINLVAVTAPLGAEDAAAFLAILKARGGIA